MMYPMMDPIAFYVGSWPVHWYGIMYLIGILGGWALLAWRISVTPRGFTQEQLSDIIFYTALGVILGGRVGYVIFYDWHKLLVHPLSLFYLWEGGMSFHGGLLGVVTMLAWYAHKSHRSFLSLTDLVAPVVPIGLGTGRLGNFINGELWGRVTDVSWGMVFPETDGMLRHPSQLYECFLEGFVLFSILWVYSRKPRPLGRVSGMFAIFYGIFRLVVENFREPDVHIGYIAGWITEGQLLTLPLILFGIYLLGRSRHETIS